MGKMEEEVQIASIWYGLVIKVAGGGKLEYNYEDSISLRLSNLFWR